MLFYYCPNAMGMTHLKMCYRLVPYKKVCYEICSKNLLEEVLTIDGRIILRWVLDKV
jgi:hypothetical protein